VTARHRSSHRRPKQHRRSGIRTERLERSEHRYRYHRGNVDREREWGLSPQRTETPTQVESANRDKTLAAPATRRMAEEEGSTSTPSRRPKSGTARRSSRRTRFGSTPRHSVRPKKQIGKRSKQANRSGRRIPISRRASANAANRSGASASASPRRWSSRSTAPPRHSPRRGRRHRTRGGPRGPRTRAEERGNRLTYMPFIAKASSRR